MNPRAVDDRHAMDSPGAAPPEGEPTRPIGAPYRRPVGGDFYLTTFPGEPDRLWIDAGFVVEGWHVRPVQRPHQPEFPGTPLRIERGSAQRAANDCWWEIVGMQVQNDPAGRERFVYELRPWQGHILRAGVELTPDSARRLTAEQWAVARHRAASDRAALFMPFYGLLPAADQDQIESRYGLPPGRATLLTASLLLLLSVYGVLLALAGLLGHGGADIGFAHDFRFVLAYLAIESLLRLGVGARGENMGSALIVVPLSALRALASRPPSENQLPAAPGPMPTAADAWLEATDVVRSLPPTADGRARLEILSPLPKEHWRAQVDLIYHRQVAYVLEEREKVPGGHRFELEESPPGMRRTRAVHHYHPDEVREVYKDRQRLKAEAWIETLAPLVGCTEPALQAELAEFTTYRPYRGVLQSILFSLLFGLLFVRTGWVTISGPGAADSVVLLALGIAMVWENAVRAARLTAGEITPSFLGRLVSPFARRALRWRPDPAWPDPQTGRHG